MAGGFHTSLQESQYLPGLGLRSVAVTGTQLVCDFQDIGNRYTALVFVVINDGASDVTVLVEASDDGAAVESGPFAPQPYVVAAGAQGSDRYGVDVVWRYWRVRTTGTSTVRWGVKGIPR
jgi:hypothetical protein